MKTSKIKYLNLNLKMKNRVLTPDNKNIYFQVGVKLPHFKIINSSQNHKPKNN